MTVSRAETMTTVTDRDRTLFYRIIRKIIKEQIKDGKLMDVPARKVFSLTEEMTGHYFDLINTDLQEGNWDAKIKELMTR